MANTIITTYEAWNRDGEIGWRWKLKTQSFTTISNRVFSTKGNCNRSLRRFILKHNFEYWDMKVVENTLKGGKS